MSTDTLTPEAWRRKKIDLWIGGYRPEAPEYQQEYQPFPPEGCRIPLSKNHPGLIEETLRYSWCFIAYPMAKGQGVGGASDSGWYVVYRGEIDESDRAARIRKDREERQEY